MPQPNSLNLQGQYQVKPKLPFIPGSEVSGKVIEIGRDVRTVAVGDPVCSVDTLAQCLRPLFKQASSSADGLCNELDLISFAYVVTPANHAIKVVHVQMRMAPLACATRYI